MFPLPIPYPAVGGRRWSDSSRSMRRRLSCRDRLQQWCNAGVASLNELSGVTDLTVGKFTGKNAAQVSALVHVCEAFSDMPKPPPDLHPAGTFFELCSSTVPHTSDGKGPVPYGSAPVALPEGCRLQFSRQRRGAVVPCA